ncbi:MAG TPA: zf-HC2 domain-containing protein [Acidobacteriaceae bacterium]|nr:zf-HC2 domain-containing protein [Acidobacteriaceae bacterium]
MNCTEFLANLTDYFDAKTAEALRTELEQHMADCSHCTVTLNTTRQTIEVYRNNELFELPNTIRQKLHQAVLAKCSEMLQDKSGNTKPGNDLCGNDESKTST